MKLTRPYALELWSLADSPILKLRAASGSEFPGQAYGATLSIKTDGTIDFSCILPVKYFDQTTKQFVQNPLWYDSIKDKYYLTSFKKIKVVIYDKPEGSTIPYSIYEIVINKVDEVREGGQIICNITGTGLAFFELGKVGKQIILNTDTVEAEIVEEGSVDKVNINYWADKIFPNHYDVGLGHTIWDSPWQYEVRMSWPGYTDRSATICYEEPAPTYWALESGQLQPKNYESLVEKERFIDVSDSNKYNISQTIAETFEVFVRYEYTYNYNTLEITGRKCIFYNDFVKDDLDDSAGIIDRFEITYQKNLSGISKTIDSTETITKMFVADIESQYSSTGLISIADAVNNPIKDNFIIDFSYLYDQGILPEGTKEFVNAYKASLYTVNSSLEACLNSISTYEKLIQKLKEEVGILQIKIDAANTAINNTNEKMGTIGVNGDLTQDNPFPDTIYSTSNPKAFMFIEMFETGVSNYFKINLGSLGILTSTLNAYVSYNGTTFGTKFINNGVPVYSGITVLTDDYGFATGIKNTNTILDGSTLRPVVNGVTLTSNKVWLTFTYNVINYYVEERKYYELVKDSCTIKLQTVYDADTETYWLGAQNISAALIAKDDLYKTLINSKKALNASFENAFSVWIKEGTYSNTDYQEIETIENKTITQIIDVIGRDFSPYPNTPVLYYDSIFFEDEQKNYEIDEITEEITKYYQYCSTPANLARWNFLDTEVEVVYTIGTNHFTYILAPESEYFLGYRKVSTNYVSTIFFTNFKVPEASYDTIDSITLYRLNNYVREAATKTVLYVRDGGSNLIDIYTYPSAYTFYYKRITVPAPSINDATLEIKHLAYDESGSLTANFATLEIYKDYSPNYIGVFPTYTLKGSILFPVSDVNFSLTYNLAYSSEHLYTDALKVMEENKKPKVSYEVQVSNTPESQLSQLGLGYLVYINDYEMNFFGEKGIVTEINYNLDSPQEDQITISNYKTKFEELFSTIIASSEQMKTSGYTYERAAAAVLPTGEIDPDTLQRTMTNQQMQMIYANGRVVIDDKGITLYSDIQ